MSIATAQISSPRMGRRQERIKNRSSPFETVFMLLLVFGLFSAIPTGPACGQEIFSIVDFDEPPGWTFSASWDLGEENLIVADLGFNRLRFYDLEGRLSREIHDLPGLEEEFYPSVIRRNGESYLLQNGSDHFVTLDQDFNIVRQVKLIGKGGEDTTTIGSIFSWTALGSSILSFSDLKTLGPDTEARWTTAFIRIPLDDPSAFDVLISMSFGVPERNRYLIGEQFLATVGDTGFFLDFRSLRIYQTGGIRYQKAKPLGNDARFQALMAHRPVLPEKIGPQHAKVIFEASEWTSHVAGLYGLNDDGLFMLIRLAPNLRHDHRWVLAEIDTSSGLITRSLSLPSQASHVVLALGDGLCAVIQKGPVESIGEQEIPSMVLIPTALLESENSPFLVRDVGLVIGD